MNKDFMGQNEKALVTGATGLIGTYLVRKLLAENVEVLVVGRSEQKIKSVFAEFLVNPKFSYKPLNISQGITEDLGEISYIFHAASPIAGEEIRYAPMNVIDANLKGTINCLEYLRQQKETKKVSGKMVVFSSATVYGKENSQDKIVSEEDTALASVLDSIESPYSESKRMIEVIARAYLTQYGVESHIVRIGYVYGYSKYYPNTAFYEFIMKAIAGEDVVLKGVGLPRRDNIYVQDVVDGILAVCTLGVPGEAYNISSCGDKHNYLAADEIAKIIVEVVNRLLGGDVKLILPDTVCKMRKPGLKLSNRKLKELDWRVKVSAEEGIERTIKAFIEEKSLEGNKDDNCRLHC